VTDVRKDLEELRYALVSAMNKYLASCPDATPEVSFEFIEVTTLESPKTEWTANCRVSVTVSV
jgi:hypothetical protein